ncbi:MAG: hypothetical protein H6850_01610 [Alphaproteobacteria bacterium]|nr:MAG: hypothetical protein H6850_01610 [Alphaproteobacteria bacterium]
MSLQGLDWFMAFSAGEMDINYNLKALNNQYDFIFYAPNSKKMMLSPVIGISFTKNKFYTKAQAGLSLSLFGASHVQEIGELRFAAGYELMDRFVFSVIFGIQKARIHDMKVKTQSRHEKYTIPRDETWADVYLAYEAQSVHPTFTPLYKFVGFEGQYEVKKDFYIVGAVQFGINDVQHGNYKIFAREDVDSSFFGMNPWTFKKGLEIPTGLDDKVSLGVSSRMRVKGSIGVLIRSGGLGFGAAP